MRSDNRETGQMAGTSCKVCIAGFSITRIVLWLIAVTIVSFAIGFGILALSGDFPPPADQSFSPLRPTAFIAPNITTVPLDSATAANVTLTLGAGELVVGGDAPPDALMQAAVFSKAAVWQPELIQSISGSRKNVTLADKGHKGKEWFAIHSPNRWEIRLNETVPIRLDATVGAGDARLSLGKVRLEALTVTTGAGDTTIDLDGYRGGRFDADIGNGVGDLTLRIPRDSNTRIQVSNGIGDVSGNGFIHEGGAFVTPAFNPSLPVNEITLNQGIGSVTLEII